MKNPIIIRLFIDINWTNVPYLKMRKNTIGPQITHELESQIDADGNFILPEIC